MAGLGLPQNILFLILFFLPAAYCRIFRPQAVFFTYQSQHIGVTDWFEMLTLCLAPLIAHIAGGAPAATYFGTDAQKPSWAARLPHFNPASIIWRYMAIADRRMRAICWDREDMAACNAVFWDGQRGRWDGSEEMMARCRQWIVKKPEMKRVPILSASSVITLVTTLQGLQATFLIISSMIPGSSYRFQQGLPFLFLPLGCLGLVRLVPAPWLSSDYGYLNPSENTPEKSEDSGGVVADRLLGSTTSKGIVYRIFWILTCDGLLGVSAAASSTIFWGHDVLTQYISTTRLLFHILYITITVVSSIIISTYVLKGQTSSTVIPCMHSAWYKTYTMVLVVIALAMIILAGLETRKQPDGKFTTLPPFSCNGTLCVPVTH
ncbi:MAG: hypothetical protein M1839_007756 [Geoglossum umbratile]|nr:MAG: hypothetical protein M1839_007756 [Geoglossum umbratile]